MLVPSRPMPQTVSEPGSTCACTAQTACTAQINHSSESESLDLTDDQQDSDTIEQDVPTYLDSMDGGEEAANEATERLKRAYNSARDVPMKGRHQRTKDGYRVIDVMRDSGMWVVCDDACNSNCHGDLWA